MFWIIGWWLCGVLLGMATLVIVTLLVGRDRVDAKTALGVLVLALWIPMATSADDAVRFTVSTAPDGPTWEITNRMGLNIATIPPEMERTVWYGRAETVVHQDAEGRLTPTSNPTGTTTSVKRSFMHIGLSAEKIVIEDFPTPEELGYGLDFVATMHQHGYLPPHHFVGGRMGLVEAP